MGLGCSFRTISLAILILIHYSLFDLLFLLVLVSKLEDCIALGDSANFLWLLKGLLCKLSLNLVIILLQLGLDVIDQVLRVSINQQGFWIALILLQYA